MGESNVSLLDLGKLSEPATKLIKAVSRAVGVLYEQAYRDPSTGCCGGGRAAHSSGGRPSCTGTGSPGI